MPPQLHLHGWPDAYEDELESKRPAHRRIWPWLIVAFSLGAVSVMAAALFLLITRQKRRTFSIWRLFL